MGTCCGLISAEGAVPATRPHCATAGQTAQYKSLQRLLNRPSCPPPPPQNREEPKKGGTEDSMPPLAGRTDRWTAV